MATIYCSSLAAGANNGTSWTDAYTSLQSAVDASASGDTILSNSTEAAPLRPATRSASNRTIITDEGPSGETWISNGYTATWTDAGGGVFSVALATKPAQVAYDFKRDDEDGTVTGVDLNNAAYSPSVDRAIAAFGAITKADLVAWYGFLSENTSTPTTPSVGEWGYSSGTLYIHPPGSPAIASVNALAQYCPDEIDAINLNGNGNQVIATSRAFGLTTILTPGAGGNAGYSVKLGGTNGRIRGVRGIANGWHAMGHAIASSTAGSRIERCINITHAAEGDSDAANPFVFFSSDGGSNYLGDRLISVLVPLLRYDGSPLQTSFNGLLGLSHTTALGTFINDLLWKRCYSLDLTALIEAKHSVSVAGVGSFISASNAVTPTQNTPSSWETIAEDCEGIGISAVPRAKVRHVRCRLNRLGLGSAADTITAMTTVGNDYYRLEDSLMWAGENVHGWINSGSASNGWVELNKSIVFIEASTGRPGVVQGHNVPFRIESSSVGTVAAAGVAAKSNQASSTTGPLVTSDSLNVFGHGMAGSYQDHSNTGAVAAKDWAYWRAGTDSKVTGGSGDIDSQRIAITTSLTDFTPLRDGGGVSVSGRFTCYVAHIGRTSSNVTVALPSGATMGELSDFSTASPTAMSPGGLKVLDVYLTSTGDVTLTPGIGDPVTVTLTSPAVVEQAPLFVVNFRRDTGRAVMGVVWRDSENVNGQLTDVSIVIRNGAGETVMTGVPTVANNVFRLESGSNFLQNNRTYSLHITFNHNGAVMTKDTLVS